MPAVKSRSVAAKKSKVSKARKAHVAKMVAARLAAVAATTNTDTEAAVPVPCEAAPVYILPGTSASADVVTPSSLASADPLAPRLSSSKRKLDTIFSLADPVIQSSSASVLPTSVVDLNAVALLFKNLLCPECPCLQLKSDSQRRKCFAIYLQVICTKCDAVPNEGYSSKTSSIDHAMEVNRKMIAAGLTVGMGHAAMMKMLEGMGMPGMLPVTYQAHLNAIHGKVPPLISTMLEEARAKMRLYYMEKEPSAFDEAGNLNIPISFDGSWPKRGHTSKFGCTAAIEVMTGLVVDFHVMSLYRQMCTTVRAKVKRRSEAAYQTWLVQHKENGCDQNYEGSSGGMEVAGARIFWGRSLDHKMRYVTLVGDGDTKTYLAITKMNPYGDGHQVRKEECVNRWQRD